MIDPREYAIFLGREYLSTFVHDGGAAVKFVVATDEERMDEFRTSVRDQAALGDYLTVAVDAATTRVHMMDQVFFDIAHQVDWDGLAARAVRTALEHAAYPPPDSGEISVASVAAHHGVDPRELTRDVNRELQERVYHDYGMVQEFRIAMLRLCQAQLQSGQVTEAEHAAVLDWLQGELRQISLLRSAMIFRRIGRHNARHMMFSLSHWLSTNGMAGLVVELDVRRLGFARRPKLEERQGLYYTKAALLDAYELLRQLIDNTDELSHCCVVVVAAPEFLSDTNRGVDAYQALKLRIYDQVRDRRRDNPFSSLIRLGATTA